MCTNGLPIGLILISNVLVITPERLQSSCYKSITTKRSSGFPTKLIDFCDYHRKPLYLKMASNKEVVREGRLTTKGQWKRLNYFAPNLKIVQLKVMQEGDCPQVQDVPGKSTKTGSTDVDPVFLFPGV